MWRTSSWVPNKVLVALIASALICQPGWAATKSTKSQPATKAEAATRVELPLPGEIAVSDRDFNHFVFPSAIAQGPIFPAGSPILGKPVYLAANTQVLLQLAAGADRPIHMIVELENGAVYKYWLRPRPIPGITHRVDGATERGHAAKRLLPAATSPRGADVELLKRVVGGELPEGFDAIELPPPTNFDKFTVIPIAGWSDHATRRIMAFSLVAVAGQTAVVAPPQFYRPGITAVLIDGDVVEENSAPTLYVIEEISSDE